jgi:hypothetical protein
MNRKKQKSSSSQNEFIKLYRIAKYASNEILLEENLENTGTGSSIFLENYGKNKKSLKFQIILMKIFYAFLFGILPILPLVAFFKLIAYLEILNFNVLIFVGSIIFSVFFLLQLLNLLLMGMINVTTIMTGRIFHWFETLPISSKKFQNLGFFTIFRSLDIPLIAFFSIFPTTMLIGTSDVLLFLVCIGISFLNIIFSFSIMIIVGKSLTKIINFNKGNSKKALLIRAINLLGFLLITLGSVYVVQWAFGYIGVIFEELLEFNPEILNLILSLVPFPLNLGYLISIFADPSRVSLLVLINIIIGFILFLIITRFVYLKAKSSLNNVLRADFEDNKMKKLPEEPFKIDVKTRSPITSYIKKDLVTATRDIQTLMVFILPIVISFVFTLAYLFGRIGGANLLLIEELIYYWMVLLIFHPIISLLLVYGVLNIEQSGESILAALPIIPRDQAKAKLIILFVLQTISVFLPSIIFILDAKFAFIIGMSFLALPFIYLELLIIFLLRISYFGKVDNHYVIEEIFPEKKTQKWAMIFLLIYAFTFWIISLMRILIFFGLLNILILILTIIALVGHIITRISFNLMFKKYYFYPKLEFPKGSDEIHNYIEPKLSNRYYFENFTSKADQVAKQKKFETIEFKSEFKEKESTNPFVSSIGILVLNAIGFYIIIAFMGAFEIVLNISIFSNLILISIIIGIVWDEFIYRHLIFNYFYGKYKTGVSFIIVLLIQLIYELPFLFFGGYNYIFFYTSVNLGVLFVYRITIQIILYSTYLLSDRKLILSLFISSILNISLYFVGYDKYGYNLGFIIFIFILMLCCYSSLRKN